MKSMQFVPMSNVHFSDQLPENCIQVRISSDQTGQTPHQNFGEIQQFISSNGTPVISIHTDQGANLPLDKARKLGGLLSKFISSHKLMNVALNFSDFANFEDDVLFSIFEGFFLGNFEFDDFKEIKVNFQPNISLSNGFAAKSDLIEKAYKLCFSVNLARYLGQQPANIINPVSLTEICKEIAESYRLKFTVFDDKELESIGANGILAVGKGSNTKPRIIILEYPGNGRQDPPLGLVGKAITFDTGGYSIKTVDSIKEMKFDKLGGMAVIGTVIAASLLNLPNRIVGIICAAENVISSEAYRLDDIITMLSGKTVEIITMDAEGRLVLADGITLLINQYSPAAIIDFATLTGGIVTALGKIRAGIFSNNDDLAAKLFSAGERSGEKIWRMPLDDEYFEFIKGNYADLKNSGGKEGHPVMGGIFLKQFVPSETPWAHLDIAGTATNNKADEINPKGANGYGIRLMINFLQSRNE